MKIFAKAKTPEQQKTVSIDGVVLPVKMRRNARARRLIMRLNKAATEVTLTLPPAISEAAGLQFAQEHADWIRKRLNERPAIVPFIDGAEIPVRGEPHVIAHRPGMRGTVWVEEGEADAPLLCVAGDGAHLARRTREWLKREARSDLKTRCAHYAQAMGLSYSRVDLRDQTTRWGSCSSSGVLSFSWRLVLAPAHVLDYVAAHEVAHLKEMNHSPRFWKLVEDALPTMNRSRKWLKTHGTNLHIYGAEG